MKKIMSFLAGIVLLVAASPSFATIQCPGNTNFVSVGDSINSVIQQCGLPQRTIQLKTASALWTYNLMSFGKNSIGFSLLFNGNTVAKMSTTEGVTKTSIKCPNGSVQIGSTPRQVVQACGQATTITNLSAQAQKRQGKIVHLIYQLQHYLPETTFIFKNGQLVGSQ